MIKKLIKQIVPAAILSPFLKMRARRRFPILRESPEKIFTHIYENNAWNGAESASGYGSDLVNTANIREALPGILACLKIKSLLDSPCGDFNWMQHVDLGTAEYIGGDIVGPLIQANERRYGSQSRSFRQIDITKDALPRVDMIFCRDCFFHLSFADITAALRNFKQSGAQYLMTTTLVTDTPNLDIPTGGYRPLSLRMPPFRVPAPIQVVQENEPDKQMGVWRLSDINL